MNLNVGSNPITIIVTAQDATTKKTYSINITRAASSAAEFLTYSILGQAGVINTSSNNGTIGIMVLLGTPVTNLVATFTTSANITSITVGGVTQVSGTTANNFTNPVTYVVTAQDGITTKPWTVTVTLVASNNASLSSLAISSGILTPSFSMTTTVYNVDVDASITDITVTPTVNESHANVTVNGAAVASGAPSGAINLSFGTNRIDVVVTAQDANTSKTYGIFVARSGSGAPINFGEEVEWSEQVGEDRPSLTPQLVRESLACPRM